jgi:FtsZ-binding cell division protein ZapB
MKDDQLKLFEERINKAIAFIETLKTREKKLIQEKEKLLQKIADSESDIRDRDSKIKELKGSQEFLKEKIESILGKLESFASIEIEGASFPGKDTTQTAEEETEQKISDVNMIIEEDIVDLKEQKITQKDDTGQRKEKKDEYQGIQKPHKGTNEEFDNSLFDNRSEGEDKLGTAPERLGIGTRSKWVDNNPFIQT